MDNDSSDQTGVLADRLTAPHLSRWKSVARRRRHRAARRLVAMRTPAAIEALARALVSTTDEELSTIARGAFAAAADQPTIDALCRVWQDTCDPGIGDLIAGNKWLATEPVELVALTAVRGAHAEVLTGAGPDLARALAELADDDPPPLSSALTGLNPWYGASAEERVHRRDLARTALAGLSGQEARDAVCEKAIEGGGEAALSAALSAGFLPSNAAHRAALLFLAGDFDRYTELDFDGALLRAAVAVAEKRVRSRLAGQASRSGRVDWLRAVAVTHDRRGEPLTDDEWTAALGVLAGTQRWDELWPLALSAPPRWTVPMLRALGGADWLPSAEFERAACAKLIALAWQCPDHLPTGTVFDATDLEGPAYSGPTRPRLALSPDGGLVAMSGYGAGTGEVRVWRLPSGEPFAHMTGLAGDVVGLAVTSDGYLAVSTRGSYRILGVARLPADALTMSVYGSAGPVAVTPDGSLLAAGATGWMGGVTGLEFRSVATWDYAYPADFPRPASPWPVAGHELRALLISPDGSLIAGGDDRGRVHLWRLPDGASAGVLTGTGGEISDLAAMPDDLLATATDGGMIRLWRLTDGAPVGTLAGPPGATQVAVTPDGALLLTGAADRSDGPIRLWRLPMGDDAGVLAEHAAASGLAVSPDGHLVVAAGPGRLTVWRSVLHELARTPVSRLVPVKAEHCRAADGTQPGERAWLDLIDELVRWRHRHDIETGDAVAASTDIEARDP